MASYQKIIVVGHLGKDPKYHETDKGLAICEFSVAVNDPYNREHVEWFNCKLFGKQAQAADKHLSKGRPVLVEGRLQTSEYTSKHGEQKRWTSLLVDRFSFIGSKEDDYSGGGDHRNQHQAHGQPNSPVDERGDSFGDDDVPF